MYKVGDSVWDVLIGWGEVADVDVMIGRVLVQFENGSVNYTLDGKSYHDNINPSLYFEEFPVPKIVRPRFRAKSAECYYYVDEHGEILQEDEGGYQFDEKCFNCGNYFETEQEAIDSEIYKAFNRIDISK